MLDLLIDSLTSGTFWTAIAAVAGILSVLVSAIYTRLTFHLLRSQNEPNVIVYVRHDESRASALQIVIENIGNAPASDLRFHLSRSIPRLAAGLSPESIAAVEPMTKGPLIDGIPSLAPRDSRKMVWGQYHGLKKALGDEPVILTYTYKHGKRKMQPMTSVLGVDSFAGTDAVDSEGARIICELKRIADSLDTFIGQYKPAAPEGE